MRLSLLVAIVVVACAASHVTAGYDQSWALRMVKQAGIAYCPGDAIVTDSCGTCDQVTIANSSEYNLQAYIAYSASENMVVVGFRGTQETSLKNWIVNLHADHTRTSYPHCNNGCEVHAGFYAAHEAVKGQVVGAVRKILQMYPGASLSITGHSLGAALAVLSAAHFQTQEGIPVQSMYCFGLPRVGDSGFSAWYASVLPDAIFVVHYHDIVPHLPPQLFGFHHITTEIWYDVEAGLDYKVCSGGEDPSCSDSVSVLDYSVSDHMTYLDYHIVGCGS